MSATGDATPEAPSLDVVFDEVKSRLAAQDVQNERLGDNARFVLTAASLLVAGFGALPGLSLWPRSSPPAPWLLAPSLAIYLFLAWSSIQGFRLRRLTTYPEPEGLRPYVAEELTFTKRRLIAAMTQAYTDNGRELAAKARWVDWAQRALMIEGGWLVALLLIHGWI